MMTLPRWFPEVGFQIVLTPLILIDLCGMRRAVERRCFVITDVQVGLFGRPGSHLWRFRFALWKQEVP